LESPPPPRSRDDGLARIAFLDPLPPPERRAVLRAYERVVAGEIARLTAAPLPSGFRREAREGAIQKLEGARRWARAVAQRSTIPVAPQVVSHPERPIGGKKK
jgi:hypothetical protein